MASGAITPGAAASPVQPIVNTRKNVPMNSAAYRRMEFHEAGHRMID
jgi:hypothetical protein